MIKTLQKKFTVTAMIAVTVLLAVLLGGINAVNAVSLSRQSDQLLTSLSMQEGFGPGPRAEETQPPAWPGGRGFLQEPMTEDRRMSALYFTLRYGADNELLSCDLRRIASVDEAAAEELGRAALESGKGYGRIGNYKYQFVEPAEDQRSVVFLDVSSQRGSALRVAALSALAGALAWCAMLALVTALSRRAIRPIAENMERQRRFVTDAGHELKTPLAIIQANVDALELTGGENKYSRNIRSQTLRLSGLMQNLLTLARIDENGLPRDLEELDLSALLAEELEMFRAPAELKGLAVRAEIRPDVRLRADRTQMGQLLSILLDNAVKYCPEGGELSVALQQQDRTVLRVSNTFSGERLPPERLFDRFYRGDSSRNQKTGGYGIGLSAARAIVSLYGGEIGAAYEGEDRIVFTVKL